MILIFVATRIARCSGDLVLLEGLFCQEACPAGRARYARGDHFVVGERFPWCSRWSQLKILLTLPEQLHVVGFEFFVAGEDGEGLDGGLRDQKAVEGVAMVGGKGFKMQDVFEMDGQELQPVGFHLVADVGD